MAFEELNTRVNGSQLHANMGNEVLLVGKGMQVRVFFTDLPTSDGAIVVIVVNSIVID